VAVVNFQWSSARRAIYSAFTLLCLRLLGCAPGAPSRPQASETVVVAPANVGSVQGVATASSLVAAPLVPETSLQLRVVLGGDVIPQSRILASDVESTFAHMPLWWNDADARVINFEGTVGSHRQVSHDKETLAFAAPKEWILRVAKASHADALVLANNHSCDRGTEGVVDMHTALNEVHGVGLAEAAPLTPTVIANKEGKRVCLIAWTTFVNDEKRFGDRCRLGRSTPRVARASLDAEGRGVLRAAFESKDFFSNCDARIAYIHGGVEYRPQTEGMKAQARLVADYVDAVVMSHPHVPEGVIDVVSRDGRTVPVFLSLGNLLSNQGVGWTDGMDAKESAEDPIRNAWTRVSTIARLNFSWDRMSGVRTLDYGYGLLFAGRKGPESSPELRMLGASANDSARVESALRKGALGSLFRNACFTSTNASGSLGEPLCRAASGRPSAHGKSAHKRVHPD
jgi:poly-gamma-glutamate capsule biosynthesis protein CapA/YwtB (metallophosphatase superfamily)